ncbi:MAG: radical SAM protein [Methanotrichaceae archaeon]|nr:radical SAM protein [Methanotrichaceae archaeon]
MTDSFASPISLNEIQLWDKMKEKKSMISLEVELTARCNNDCSHCYVNLPADDVDSRKRELTLDEIETAADEAMELGTMWCLITGGEPLLREDFSDIYLTLKKKGLLVSVFTNACLLREEHVELFRRYPPRDIEVTVYGVTKQTYEHITRKKGSFETFKQGLDLLLDARIKVRLKTMAMKSNLHEIEEIAKFCRERTKDFFRFDPFLQLRHDGNELRNQLIRSERLSPQEIVALERSDPARFNALEIQCQKLSNHDSDLHCHHIIHCGAGRGSLSLSHDAKIHLCSSLYDPNCIYDFRSGSLTDAYTKFVPKIRMIDSGNQEFLQRCHICSLINLCMWCPARAHLEVGNMDGFVDYFCQVARARAEAMGITVSIPG